MSAPPKKRQSLVCSYPKKKDGKNEEKNQKPQKKTLKPIAGQVPSFHQLPKGCRFQPRCPYAMPKCLQKEPPKFFLNKNSSHHALCWLHDGSPESQPLLEKMQKEQY